MSDKKLYLLVAAIIVIAVVAGFVNTYYSWCFPVLIVVIIGVVVWVVRAMKDTEAGKLDSSNIGPRIFWGFGIIIALGAAAYFGNKVAFRPSQKTVDFCKDFYQLIEVKQPEGSTCQTQAELDMALRQAVVPFGGVDYYPGVLQAVQIDIYNINNGSPDPSFPFPNLRDAWNQYQTARANFVMERLRVAIPVTFLFVFAISLIGQLLGQLGFYARWQSIGWFLFILFLYNALTGVYAWNVWFKLPTENESIMQMVIIGALVTVALPYLYLPLDWAQRGVDATVDAGTSRAQTGWGFTTVLWIGNVLTWGLSALAVFSDPTVTLLNLVFPHMINSVINDQTLTMTNMIIALNLGMMLGNAWNDLLGWFISAVMAGGNF